MHYQMPEGVYDYDTASLTDETGVGRQSGEYDLPFASFSSSAMGMNDDLNEYNRIKSIATFDRMEVRQNSIDTLIELHQEAGAGRRNAYEMQLATLSKPSTKENEDSQEYNEIDTGTNYERREMTQSSTTDNLIELRLIRLI